MTCPQCGSTLSSGAVCCAECGNRVDNSSALPQPSGPAPNKARIETLARTAWKILEAIVRNPVEKLPAIHAGLQKQEVLDSGLVLSGLFDLCVVIGLLLAIPHWAGNPGSGDVLKVLLFGIVPPAAIASACALARKVFKGKRGGVEDDVFIAGVSVMPAGIVTLLSGIPGGANIEVEAAAACFALTYTVRIISTGCTQISRISIVRAVPTVPTILLIVGWLSKSLLTSIL